MRISFIIFTLIQSASALSGYYLFQERPSLLSLQKLKSVSKLIRSQNISPTIALNIAGGYIMNPSCLGLIKKPAFLASVLITQSVMASCMILNDIHDLPIDRINNPERPLVTGEISVLGAKRLVFGLLLFGEALNIRFIPRGLQYISRLSSLFAVLYTPFFKRALVLKNAACAALVASSVLFSGFVSSSGVVFGPRLKLLLIATNMIFLGSFTSEILLDIADEPGDKINDLRTLPIVYGKDFAWGLAYFSMYMNILINALDLLRNFGFFIGLGFIILCGPALNWLRDIRYYEYSKDFINEYGKKVVLPMGFALVYFEGIAKFMPIL
jgi:geranylgeranylglycerol-phosphate geranylgeranyltransferase